MRNMSVFAFVRYCTLLARKININNNGNYITAQGVVCAVLETIQNKLNTLIKYMFTFP